MKVKNLTDVKLIFDEKERTGQKQLNKLLNAPSGLLYHAIFVVGRGASPVATDGQKMLCGTASDEKVIYKGHKIDCRLRQRDANVQDAKRDAGKAWAAKQCGGGPVFLMHWLLLSVGERTPPPRCPRVNLLPRTRVAWLVMWICPYSHGPDWLKRQVMQIQIWKR